MQELPQESRPPTGRRAGPLDGAALALSAFMADPDKRRAMALSITLHLLFLLLLLLASLIPRPEPLPAYIVIDVGTPAFSEETTHAPTAEDPAPPAPEPQVASSEIGDPRELAAPEEATTAPEPEVVTAQPPAPAAPPAQAAQAPAEPTDAVEVPAPPLPQPQVAEAAPLREQLPLAEAPATTLPEIDAVLLDPRPLSDPISLPRPEARAEVSEARSVAMEPTANVSEARELSPPQPSAAVAESLPVEAPQPSAQVSQATGLTAPNATASVAAARQLEAPGVEASVSGAVDLSTSGVQAAVSGHTPLAPPAATAFVGSQREVSVTPQARVAQVRDVPLPTVRAELMEERIQSGSPTTEGRASGATDVEASVTSPRQPGGNAPTSGQTGPPDPLATAEGRGRAASPDGVGDGTGAPPQPRRAELATRRNAAVAVLVDNVGGYPQHGLREASMIVEMPVEGGLTRLMPIYDKNDPARVGPVRSARDYFVELAQRSRAVLVHDGGSPGALVAIADAEVPTLNAYNRGELFARGGERGAPYNLFSTGTGLRDAVSRLLPGESRTVSGNIYALPEIAAEVAEVNVRYSGAYESGFVYDKRLELYRWLRDGDLATHADGQSVLMDAVLVGEISATVIPGDDAGRLAIPIQGGSATLYMKGRAVRGEWEAPPGIGLRFKTDEGELVELRNLRTWVILTPTYSTRSEL